MTNATKKPGGWSAVRQQLTSWNKPALLALVKDLYEAASVNRDFIRARRQAEESGGEALEKYRGKIVEQFFPARGFGKLKLGEARRAILDYHKATGMVVRNAMEDFHCEHLTDEQMKELNPIIRNAIYTALYAIQHGGDEPWCQRFFEHHLKMIPHYWETLHVPVAWLPEGAKEGTVLRLCFEIDKAAMEEGKQRVQGLLDELGDQP